MTVPFELLLLKMKLVPWNSTVRSCIADFLVTLWQYEESAYTFIGTRLGDKWQDHPITGNRRKRIREILKAHSAREYDIYFCPNAFSKPIRRKQYALPSRYAWCDIDDAHPHVYDPLPNILWETSPGRYQGLWIWRDVSEGVIAEQYSKNLVYRHGGDRTGWSITKMLRLPGTINHKESYDRPVVRLHHYDSAPKRMPLSLAFVKLDDVIPSSVEIDLSTYDSAEILKRYRRKIGTEVSQLIVAKKVTRPDRSKRVFQIVAALIEAGASDGEIAAVLLVNAYFLSKWGADADEAHGQIAQIRARLGVAR